MQELTYDKILTTIVVIVLLLGAYNTIMSAIKNHREEKKIKNSPLAELQKQVGEHTKMLDNDNKRIEDLDERIDNIKEQSTIMLKGVRALLSHEINGNSVQELGEGYKEINDYLIRR